MAAAFIPVVHTLSLVYAMKNFRQTLNLNPIISLLAGCINQNEISPLTPYPRPVPDAFGIYSPVPDGHSCFAVQLHIEFFFMGIICSRVGTWYDRGGDVCKNE